MMCYNTSITIDHKDMHAFPHSTGREGDFFVQKGVKMNEKQDFMRQKPVFGLLISMSVPVVLSMFIQALYNIVDSIWVTRLGTDALTAVSLAFPMQNAIMSFGVGMGVGIGSVVSMHLGAGERGQADRAASMGVLLVLIHCVIFFAAGAVLTRPFVSMFTDDPRTLEWACDYTRIVMCLSFGELLQMCFEKIFQGVGRMKTTMVLMASGCIINIVLDPILIFGWFGLPALGVRGAAIATVIGQISAMLLYVGMLLTRDVGVHIRLRGMKPDAGVIGRIYQIGVPSSLMLAMPSVLTGILNGMLAAIDGVCVAVFGLYYKLQTLVNMPACGVIQGMRPIISYNYGAGEHARVRRTIACSLRIVAVIMLAGTIASLCFPAAILRIFDADADLMAGGIIALRLIGPSFVLSAAGVVASGVFEALGQGRDSLLISLLRQLVIIVPVGWALSRLLGAPGIWLAFPIAETAGLIVSAAKLRGKHLI